MVAVIQRVTQAQVTTAGKRSVKIGPGLVALVGVADSDTSADALKLGKKLVKLRLMADGEDKLNLTLAQTSGTLLLVSQFTLIADIGSGNRPSFAHAAKGVRARQLFDEVVATCREQNINVKTGFFGQYMAVRLTNDGPVTLVLDTQKF